MDDNNVQVEAVLQMADCPMSFNLSTLRARFSAKIGSSLFIIEKFVYVTRTGNEGPDISMVAETPSTVVSMTK